jgi:hypothetical protein
MKYEELPDILSQAEVKKTDKAKKLWQRRARQAIHCGGLHLSGRDNEYFRFNLRIIRDSKTRTAREEQGQCTHAFVLTDNLVLTVLPVSHLSINRDNASRQIGARLHVLQILHSATYPTLRNHRNTNCTCKNVNIYSGLTAFGRMIQGIIIPLCLHIWIRTGLNGGNMCGHTSWRKEKRTGVKHLGIGENGRWSVRRWRSTWDYRANYEQDFQVWHPRCVEMLKL